MDVAGRQDCSILEVLMKSSTPRRASVDQGSEDVGKYFVYAYRHFNVNADSRGDPDGRSYLLVAKNNSTINFHAVRHYCRDAPLSQADSDLEVGPSASDTYMMGEDDRKLEFKKNSLGLKTMYIAKTPHRTIQKRDLSLIVEATVEAESYRFNFCACLEQGTRLTLFYYDPEEFEYLEANDTITLDRITMLDLFPGVKSVYDAEVLQNFTEVYTFLSTALRKQRVKLKSFDEVESLLDLTVRNYKSIKSIVRAPNYDGLCINKCYLDRQIVDSLTSFSYLDDSMIDFFNQFTYEHIMDDKQKDTWVILTTYFLRKIRQYKDPEEAYRNTWKWTRKFKRPLPLNHFIFIPINLSEVHWSLVIIAYPKYAIRYRDNKSEKRASIIHLDSLGTQQLDPDICDCLKNYLCQEFHNRCKPLREKGFEFVTDAKSWDVVTPTRGVPLQNNGYDCGIYLIEYIMYLVLNQRIFAHLIPKYYDQEREGPLRGQLPRYSKWFTQAQIQQRRLNMKQVLKFMCDNPYWSLEEGQVKYIKDRMVKQY